MTRGRLLLLGSGEFTPVWDDLDRRILASLPKARPLVAIVPTASGQEETPAAWADNGIAHFTALGADAVGVMVVRREDAHDPRWEREVRRADWIYFSGGRPQHAIGVLEHSPFWRAVLERNREGAVLAGSSAGAMMLGEKSYAPDEFDEQGYPRSVSIRDGLGVLRGLFVIPHFDLLSGFPPERVNDWIARWPVGLRGLGIDEDTAVVEQDGAWRVEGKGRAITMRSFAEREVHAAGTTLDGIVVSN